MLGQEHVAAHVEQGMLGTELRLEFALGVGPDVRKQFVAGGELLLRRVFPSLVADAAGAIEIQLEVLGVTHHQGVAFLLGELDDVVGVEPVPVVRRLAEVGFPVVVADLLYAFAELLGVVDTEQVIVRGPASSAGQHGQNHCCQQISDDKSLHRFLVYIC